MLLPDVEKKITNFKRIIAKYEAQPIATRPSMACFKENLVRLIARRADLIGRKVKKKA